MTPERQGARPPGGRREGGVTLVEMMISLFVGTLVLIGVLALWEQTQRAYMQGAEAADVQQNLRVAMERIVQVVQGAGANPTNQTYAGASANDPAFTAFRQAGDRCLRLYEDLDGDGSVLGTNENVSFSWSGTAGSALTQESGGGPDAGQAYVGASTNAQELALKIVPNPGGTPIFQYYTGLIDATPNTLLAAPDAADCQTPTPATRTRIGRIVITLTAQGTVGSQTFTKTLVSEVRPRNVP